MQKYLQQTRWARNAMSEQELKKFNTLVSLFRRYGQQYDVDWLLMAAQGYQESQLDQSRRLRRRTRQPPHQQGDPHSREL